MVDAPYGLDFLFNDITDVHFGNPWVAIWGGGFGIPSGVTVTFPGESGGTPGFTFSCPPFPIRPSVVLKPSLSHDFHTDGGMSVRGFQIGDKPGGFTTVLTEGGAAVLECQGVLKDKFVLRFGNNTGHGPDYGVYLFSSDFMSPGKTFRFDDRWSTGGNYNPAPWCSKHVISHTGSTSDITVDPKKFTIDPHGA